jgi:excisionase family DNA binding protein
MEQLTMTIEDVALALGVNINTAYAAARKGELPVIRVGRRYLVPRAAFAKMLEGAGAQQQKSAEVS